MEKELLRPIWMLGIASWWLSPDLKFTRSRKPTMVSIVLATYYSSCLDLITLYFRFTNLENFYPFRSINPEVFATELTTDLIICWSHTSIIYVLAHYRMTFVLYSLVILLARGQTSIKRCGGAKKYTLWNNSEYYWTNCQIG